MKIITGRVAAGVRMIQKSDFFIQGHLAVQVRNTLFRVQSPVFIGIQLAVGIQILKRKTRISLTEPSEGASPAKAVLPIEITAKVSASIQTSVFFIKKPPLDSPDGSGFSCAGSAGTVETTGG